MSWIEEKQVYFRRINPLENEELIITPQVDLFSQGKPAFTLKSPRLSIPTSLNIRVEFSYGLIVQVKIFTETLIV